MSISLKRQQYLKYGVILFVLALFGQETLQLSQICVSSSPKILFRDTTDYTSCNIDNDPSYPGECKKFQDCQSALKQWKENNTQPQHCYFEGFDEFVCCRDNMTTSPNLNDNYHYVVAGLPTISGEFPFMAALGWTSSFTNTTRFLCGGALITSQYVLTAAHCLKTNGESPSIVRLGGDSLNNSNAEDYLIESIIPHPAYDDATTYNDIALIKLKTYPLFPSPICIWNQRHLSTNNVTVIGYGHTKFGGPPSKDLLKAPLYVVPNDECKNYYKPDGDTLKLGVQRTQLCARDTTNGRDTCQGDSGGPLLITVEIGENNRKDYVAGITSLGQGCGGNVPGIYTRVSEYVDWIESQIPKFE